MAWNFSSLPKGRAAWTFAARAAGPAPGAGTERCRRLVGWRAGRRCHSGRGLSLPLSVPRASPAGSSPQDRPGSGTQVGSFRGTVAVRTLKHGTPTPTGPWRTKVFLPESAPWALAIGHQVLLQPALGPQPGSDAVLGPDHCPRGAGRCSPASKMADGASQQTQDLKQLVPSDNQRVVEATFKGFLASSPIVTRVHILRG